MSKLIAGVVLALVMFSTVGTGVAFADHDNPAFDDVTLSDGNTPHWGPVGQNLVDGSPHVEGESDVTGHQGSDHGFANENSSASEGIANNPNCPSHWGGTPPNPHIDP